MTFADWPAEEPHHPPVSLPTIVSTTDLFDGELFGDELIDIYNSTVGDGAHGKLCRTHQSYPIVKILESFLTCAISLDITLPEAKDAKEIDEDHPGTKMAVTAAAIDDGLGAFRPSTSFNDLTTLLPPEGQKTVTDADKKSAPKITKKRGIQHNVEVPAAKRKAVAPRGARRPSAKKSAATAVGKPDATAQLPATVASGINSEDNTPNPLIPDAAGSAGVEQTEDDSKTPTEADFKSIAQAAVSNLIMSVSNAKSSEEASSADKPPVDTSTAHIKALTGNNWVAACSSNASTVSANSADKGNNRVRRQNLTADERAQQNRDRNREHARNTRLRKKAYVEELKRTLTELVAQRDATEAEKRQVAQRELEQREVRFRVTEEFLKLKGRNEANAARWSAILEEVFSLTMPVMDFYKSAGGEKVGSEITLKGVASVMEDSKNFAAFLRAISSDKEASPAMQFHCDRKHFFMDGCNAFLEWTATFPSCSQVRHYDDCVLLIMFVYTVTLTMPIFEPSQLSLKGVIRCAFSPASNKLVSACMTFNTGAFLSQIRSKGNVERASEDSAAEAAASEADAILDSLQMPKFNTVVPSNVVTVVPPSSASSASEGSLEKGECDDSLGEQPAEKTDEAAAAAAAAGMTTRRVRRSD